MAQQSPVLSALTSPKAFSALAGVAFGIIIFLVTAFAMGLFTKPTEEQLLEQAREQAIPPELSRAKNDEFLAAHGKEAGYTVTASGLRYRVIKPGTGKKPESASATVKVHYTGKFIDGTTFDSSEGRAPLEFEVGAGQMIAGFDNGVVIRCRQGAATGTVRATDDPARTCSRSLETSPKCAESCGESELRREGGHS